MNVNSFKKEKGLDNSFDFGIIKVLISPLSRFTGTAVFFL